MHSLAALLALAGIVTSPVVARTRFFCQSSGVEISDCAERDVPAVPVVRGAGCCDQRLFLPLTGGKLADKDGSRAVESPVLPEFPAASPAPVRPRAASLWAAPCAAAGPPLFVQHKALLI